jgi:sirohydrochlorin ferrochelatase
MSSPSFSNLDQAGKSSGLLLIGHGTRHAAGRAEFLETVEQVRLRLPGTRMEAAFLERCEPDIATAVDRLVAAGVTQIVAEPVLLLSAGHARRDIPEALTSAARQHEGVAIRQAPHLGCHPALVELSKQRFLEALDANDEGKEAAGSKNAERRVGWVMVGRGSSDVSALAEMRQFVELRLRETPVAHAVTCFLAVARPRLEDAVEQMASADVTHVVVKAP